MIIWLKAFHIIFMVTWFAGLFYLPRLYVYHAMPENKASFALFKIMEWRLFVIMTIGGALTTFFGILIFLINIDVYLLSSWFIVKIFFIVALITYHIWCYRILIHFKHDTNVHDHRWYRWFNEAPSILLIVIILLAVTKAF